MYIFFYFKRVNIIYIRFSIINERDGNSNKLLKGNSPNGSVETEKSEIKRDDP